MTAKVPDSITQYLWDVAPETVSTEKHSRFIIERVLEYGDFDSVRWLTGIYKKDDIVEVLTNSKRISPKSGCLYALYFGIPKENLLCIKKPFIQKQNRF